MDNERKVFWYKFTEFDDVVEYKYTETKIEPHEYEDALSEWSKSRPRRLYGPMKMEEVDAPPREVVTKKLDSARLRLAFEEHHVALLARELEYQNFLDENKLR